MIADIGLSVFGVIALIFMPESPRFLIVKKRYDEARKAFGMIGRMNGVEGGEEFRFKNDRSKEEQM